MSRLTHLIENHPILGTALSAFSVVAGAAQWVVDNADVMAKLIGLHAAILGVAAGWYAFRINRRRWHRMQSDRSRWLD